MKPPVIYLVGQAQSPTLPGLRKQLRAAMMALGWMATWQECLVGDPALPKQHRMREGDFVLANGRLVDASSPAAMEASLLAIGKQAARWAWLKRPLAAGSVVPGILLAFFPKCAGCWAAYFSVFNSLGLGVPYMPWMKHVLAASLVLSAVYFAWMAKRRGRWLPFGFQLAGFAAVLAAQYAVKAPALMWVGVGLVFGGSLLFAMPEAWMRRLVGERAVEAMDRA